MNVLKPRQPAPSLCSALLTLLISSALLTLLLSSANAAAQLCLRCCSALLTPLISSANAAQQYARMLSKAESSENHKLTGPTSRTAIAKPIAVKNQKKYHRTIYFDRENKKLNSDKFLHVFHGFHIDITHDFRISCFTQLSI